MKKNILIVDDDASVRESLKKLLKAEGYRVLTAAHGAEALALFTSEAIHLVVMDVNLGEEDGWDTFGQMAETNSSVPTVIVTAEFGQSDRAIAAGVDALIEKPMDVAAFLSILKGLLEGKGNRRVAHLRDRERHCRIVSRSCDAFRRDLERRYLTPLNMSWFERLQLVDNEAN